MAKVEFEIPNSAIEKVAKERIKELEHKLDLAEKREERAKAQIKELMADRESVIAARNQMEELVDEWVEHLDLWGKYDRA